MLTAAVAVYGLLAMCIRVLETVEPSTGRRSLHVMEGLSPDEIRAVQRALSRAGFEDVRIGRAEAGGSRLLRRRHHAVRGVA